MVVEAITKFFTRIFGSRNERLVKRYLAMAGRVGQIEPQCRTLTDAELRARSDELRSRVAAGESIRDLIPEAFAVLRETMDRHIGIRNVFRQPEAYDLADLSPESAEVLRVGLESLAGIESPLDRELAVRRVELSPEFYDDVRRLYPESTPGSPRARLFDVQLVGGAVLFDHKIAEMATGEGKTLAAPLAAYLNYLTGRRTHIVTVNDYLVQRDRDWMAPAYEALGLTVGAIQSQMDNAVRKVQYDCDITYGTNNEFGFDYLRDNMKGSVEDQVQGPLDYAVIDEVDNILIDEARTPLIISGAAADDVSRYQAADAVARKLIQLNREYDAIERQVNSTRRTIREAQGDLSQARKDDDAKAVAAAEKKLEEAEARLPGLEAKLAATTRHYEVELDKKSAHLTHEGIAAAQAEAGVGSFYVGANMEWPHLLEQSLRAHVIYHRDKDYVVQNGEVIIVDEFTGRLMIGRQWSDGLHQAVEAKERVRVKEETQTMATVTIQNFFKLYKMLGGMTGTAMTEAEEFYKIYKLDVVAIPTNRPCVRDDQNDRIYKTEAEKFNAIVEEIQERAKGGQPVLVGTTSIEKSELVSSLLTRRHGIEHEVLNARQHAREAEIVAKAGQQHTAVRSGKPVRMGNVTIATNMAGRGTDIKLGPGVAAIGGLHVVGTERHEARRIDNQLRGRAGRQGDPGSSRFFLSLQDELLAVFAGEWTLKVLGWLGLDEGMAIEDKRINKGIARAQKKVEEKNFLIRKRLLEYDEVMDTQRKIFYELRQALLEGRDIEGLVWGFIDEAIDDAATDFLDPLYPYRGVAEWSRATFDAGIDPDGLRDRDFDDIADAIRRRARDEARESISVTIGEYLEEGEDDTRKWDASGLSSWAMSRFGVNLSITQVRKMEPREVEEALLEAAWKRIDEFDFSPIQPYLEPDYARKQFAEWAAKKFDLKLDIERIDPSDREATVQTIRDAVRDLYRRREIEYPVQYALRASFGDHGGTEDPYGASALADWANRKFQLGWKLEDVQGQKIETLHEKLVAAAEGWMTDGRLVAEIDQAVAHTGGSPDRLAEWARERFESRVSADELSADPKSALADAGRAFFRRELTELERFLLLDIFDRIWIDHLYALDHLKDAIGLRGFAERDPLVEYKREGFRMFQQMQASARDRVTDLIFKVQLTAPTRSRYRVSQTRHDAFGDGGYGVGKGEYADRGQPGAESAGEVKVKQIVRTGPAVGPNDPCPCGSGKKHKKCCGRKSAAAT